MDVDVPEQRQPYQDDDRRQEEPKRHRSRSPSRRSRSVSPASRSADSDSDSRHKHKRSKKRSRRSRSRSPKRSRDTKKAREVKEEELIKVGTELATLSGATSGRAGGVYIAPHRRREAAMGQDKLTEAAQKLSWEALRKSLNGLINKVSISNIQSIVFELFKENLIRGRGLLCRSLMKSQGASPNFTGIYAALVAIINTKMPEIGELLIHRLVDQFKKSYRRNNKANLISSVTFIAHLVNQRVAGVILPLEILSTLLERPTNDSVEVSIQFVQEVAVRIQELVPKTLHNIFDRFRAILHEGTIDKRVQFMIEALFAVRKAGFKEHPAIAEGLDLVEEEDQITHETITLDAAPQIGDELNYFHFDPEFAEHEQAYNEIKADILGDDEEGEEGAAQSGGEDDEDHQQTPAAATVLTQKIEDRTETDLINLKRTIYLTIMSAVDFEACATMLLKMNLREGQEIHVSRMIVECCMQERTYIRFYGLLAQRFCLLFRSYQDCFIELFAEEYTTCHRLETNRLRNVAKLFAHLLHTDAIPWVALDVIKLTEKETTSSSRIFIKILFQELAEYLGIVKLNKRFQEPDMQEFYKGLFPKDIARNTRFAINFFTLIGLGGLTDDMREWLKDAPKRAQEQAAAAQNDASDSSDESDSDSSSDSSDSSSSSSSSPSSSSVSHRHKRVKRE